MCFGKDITNKINKTSSRPSSPIPVEAVQSLPIPNNILKVQIEENIQMEIQGTGKSYLISVMFYRYLIHDFFILAETFEDCIPMSQAVALMDDLAAFDQIFDKNSNSLDAVKTGAYLCSDQ